MVMITALALQAISNLPKASALKHFWKNVNKDCYEQCKSLHEFIGQFCFLSCCTIKHLAKKQPINKKR